MKKQFIFLICLSTLLLCSCSSENNFAYNYMVDNSKIQNEAGYQTYQEIKDQLNENGEYDTIPDVDDAIPASATIREKPICATLTQNSKLNVTYYSDPKCEHEIRPNVTIKGECLNYLECYLAPGESIYAKVDNSDELYEFSRFRIINDIENRVESSDNWWSIENSIYSITVPEGFIGTDIIVEPLGVYHYRILSLSDYINLDGLQRYTDGQWFVNDEKYDDGNINILPDISYTVKYNFDENLYYTDDENCIPTPYYIDEKKGIVEFVKDNNGNNTSFLVRLHPFANISITNDKKISSILRNQEEVKSSENITSISKLKEGEVITVELNDPNFKVNGISDYSKSDNGYKFTYVVPKATKTDNNYSFNVEKWGKKSLPITVDDKNKNKFNLIGAIADIFASDNADDSAVVIEVSGSKAQTYLYKDIKAGKTITINEPDTVTVKINKNVLSAGNIKILINGSKTYEVNSQSKSFKYNFKYADIDSLNIEINELI